MPEKPKTSDLEVLGPVLLFFCSLGIAIATVILLETFVDPPAGFAWVFSVLVALPYITTALSTLLSGTRVHRLFQSSNAHESNTNRSKKKTLVADYWYLGALNFRWIAALAVGMGLVALAVSMGMDPGKWEVPLVLGVSLVYGSQIQPRVIKRISRLRAALYPVSPRVLRGDRRNSTL